ncbi:MAG: hypothetical protein CMP51_04320 [Flavobacteriales bacterium]|nr:hypothetical protein [Flavobacteriales bacterium]|tara:strand:+ start:2617 stop:3915 length:1299 start_codon:yes stop_codon:yes gene_type:complete
MRLSSIYNKLNIFLFLLLTLSGGGIFFVYFKKPAYLLLCAVSLLTLLLYKKPLKRVVFSASIVTLIFTYIIILYNYLLAGPLPQEAIKYGFYLLNIMTCVLICIHIFNNIGIDKFLVYLRTVLRIILIISLITFILGIVVGNSYLSNLPKWIIPSHTVQHFNYLFFYDLKHEYTFFGIDLVRNQGWFWEPGINQIYLNILLFLEGFVFKQKKKWIILLIIFSIFTTFSTSGFIIMVVLILSLYMDSIYQNIVRRNPLIVILISASLIVSAYYIGKNIIIPNVLNKAVGNEESSFQKRMFDLIQCPCIASDYPLSGVGLDLVAFREFRKGYTMKGSCRNALEFVENITSFKLKPEFSDKGSTNSLTGMMATMGFPVFFIFFYFLLNQTLFTERKKLFLFIIIISVFFEPVLFRPFFLIFIISGMISFFSRFTK